MILRAVADCFQTPTAHCVCPLRRVRIRPKRSSPPWGPQQAGQSPDTPHQCNGWSAWNSGKPTHRRIGAIETPNLPIVHFSRAFMARLGLFHRIQPRQPLDRHLNNSDRRLRCFRCTSSATRMNDDTCILNDWRYSVQHTIARRVLARAVARSFGQQLGDRQMPASFPATALVDSRRVWKP
jgi:hypothetical protein